MAFSTNNQQDEVMSEINMTPLVDVMLVLLIIFIITMPVMQHSIKLNLPQARRAGSIAKCAACAAVHRYARADLLE